MKSLLKPPSKAIYIALFLLLLFVLIVSLYRIFIKQQDELPTGDTAWSIVMYHEIEALSKDATVFIPPPWDTRHARFFSESVTHPHLRQRRTKTERESRDFTLTANNKGRYKIKTEFKIHVSHLPFTEFKRKKLSEQDLSAWLSSSNDISVNTAIATSIATKEVNNTSDPLQRIEKLFHYVSSNIRIDGNFSSNSEKVLTNKRADHVGLNNALIALLRTERLPARIVTGVNLQATSSLQPIYWSEVYVNGNWFPLDPINGYINKLPSYYIPFRKGENKLINTNNKAKLLESRLEIIQLPFSSGAFMPNGKQVINIFNLNRLPPDSRELLAILLLLPLGALSTQIIRQFAGVRTYGTFTPTLLALSGTQVELTTAIMVFSLVILIGVGLRSTLPTFKLTPTSRLTIVFTLVALSLAFVTSGLSYFNPDINGAVVLLPMVILTMLVDRIYTVYDESGIHTVMVRLFWTVLSAFVSLYVLLQMHWGTWLLTYPEFHALTLATILVIGLYSGPKLKKFPALGFLFERTNAPSKQISNDTPST